MFTQEILAQYADSDWTIAELQEFGICSCGNDVAFYSDRDGRYCPDCWEGRYPND